MSECGKGGKEWVRVDKSYIFFNCGNGGKGVDESGKKLKGVEWSCAVGLSYIFLYFNVVFLFMIVNNNLKIKFWIEKNFFMCLADYKILFDGRCYPPKNLNFCKWVEPVANVNFYCIFSELVNFYRNLKLNIVLYVVQIWFILVGLQLIDCWTENYIDNFHFLCAN